MLKFINPTSWEDVFQDWKQREGNDPGWIHCATTIKGWPDWESWRRFSAEQIHAADRDWEIYECTDPMRDIPTMLVGPFTGWQSRLPKPNVSSFAELVAIPEQAQFFREHEKVAGMMKHFPPSTMFIGLCREDSGSIVCLEGHHRATAVALSLKAGSEIDFGGPVQIALAVLHADELTLLDQVLARGSSKDPKDASHSALSYIAHPT